MLKCSIEQVDESERTSLQKKSYWKNIIDLIKQDLINTNSMSYSQQFLKAIRYKDRWSKSPNMYL